MYVVSGDVEVLKSGGKTDGWQFNFTIPLTTPPGKYLLRIENIFPEDHPGYRQFYINCALVNIIGPGGGVPKGFARFPGTYKEEDPGESCAPPDAG